MSEAQSPVSDSERLESRDDLLAQYGRFYGAERLSVAFTSTLEGEGAKRVTTKGWDKTPPLADAEFGAGLLATRGKTKNPVIVLRPSNLIVLECDSGEDLTAIERLGLPETVTVISSGLYKRHFWFRPDPEIDHLPFVAFRFEHGKITADTNRYFLAPPSIHPSGAVYTFMNGPEIGIATLSFEDYDRLCIQARHEDDTLRDSIELDEGAKITEGGRRGFLFRYACMLRRWGHSEAEILEMTQRYNEQRCEPPVERHLVAVQVAGAMKKQGNQEILEPVTVEGVERHYRPLDLWQEVPPVDWVIENFLVGSEATLLVADGGSGKSILALAASLAVAGGSPNFIGQVVRKHGKVVYADEEGSRDLALQRMQQLGITDEQRRNIDYLNHQGVDMFEKPDLFLEDVRLIQPTLVIFDSHSEVSRSAVENDKHDMAVLWGHFKRVARETGAAVLVIHHTNASGDRSRGSTAIRNACDQELTMFKQPDDSQIIRPTKARRLTKSLQFTYTEVSAGRYELKPGPKLILPPPMGEGWPFE